MAFVTYTADTLLYLQADIAKGPSKLIRKLKFALLSRTERVHPILLLQEMRCRQSATGMSTQVQQVQAFEDQVHRLTF